MISGRLVRVVGVLSVVLGLAGCQSLDDGWMNAMSDIGLASSPSESEASAPAAEAQSYPASMTATADTGVETWCAEIAAQARDKAVSEGYDVTSVQRRYAVSYRQCLGVVEARRH